MRVDPIVGHGQVRAMRSSVLVTSLIALTLGCGDPSVAPDAAARTDGASRDGDSVDAPATPDAGPGLAVDAGADVTVALPTRSAVLHGSVTASDGTTPAVAWSVVTSVDATLAGPNTLTLTASGLVPGTYTFRLTATLASGASASDDVVVTVTSSGTTYFVATSGSDATGDGSRAHPWATLAHACGVVHGADDVIHVDAGDYTESAQCVLAPRVSIEGAGEGAGGTHIVLFDPPPPTGGRAYTGSIQLASVAGTEGSQSISNLWLDGRVGGTDVVHKAIMVHGRSHVLVRHVTFTHFLSDAANFLAIRASGVLVHDTGNELSSSTVTDCSDRGNEGGGVIIMGGQDGIVIRDNTFHQTGRAMGQNGNVIGGVPGHNRGWSYYRNVSTKPDYEGAQEGAGGRGWNFAIEVWDNEGGTEIWGNSFYGGGNAIDIGGSNDTHDGYDYSWYVHDNLFALDAPVPSPTGAIVPMGVQFEVPATDGIISHNHFVHLAHGVQIILTHTGNIATQRIAIHHNYFEGMGLSDGTVGGSMVDIVMTTGMLIGDIHIDHNTMISAEGLVGGTTIGLSRAALLLDNRNPVGTLGPIDFRNNVVLHVGQWGYITFNGSALITDVTSSHNILFDGAMSNDWYIHETTSLTPSTPTRSMSTQTGNLMVDPLLGADGHPMAGSPALGAGLDLGYGTTIGAFAD